MSNARQVKTAETQWADLCNWMIQASPRTLNRVRTLLFNATAYLERHSMVGADLSIRLNHGEVQCHVWWQGRLFRLTADRQKTALYATPAQRHSLWNPAGKRFDRAFPPDDILVTQPVRALIEGGSTVLQRARLLVALLRAGLVLGSLLLFLLVPLPLWLTGVAGLLSVSLAFAVPNQLVRLQVQAFVRRLPGQAHALPFPQTSVPALPAPVLEEVPQAVAEATRPVFPTTPLDELADVQALRSELRQSLTAAEEAGDTLWQYDARSALDEWLPELLHLHWQAGGRDIDDALRASLADLREIGLKRFRDHQRTQQQQLQIQQRFLKERAQRDNTDLKL